MTTEYGNKDPDEVLIFGIDLTERLELAETIATCSFEVTSVSGLGTDSTPASLSGVADITAAPIVRQKVAGGTAGWTYRLKATATTNQGRTVVASAIIPVVEGA